jgi:methylated-DNA-[protein]-cysteine S-methyltransferase
VIHLTVTDSPIGPLTLAARGSRLCLLHFGGNEELARTSLEKWYPAEPCCTAPLEEITRTLSRYFSGELAALDGVPVELNGTSFQLRVWNALRSVQAGTTTSYGQLAERIGAPKAVRAVGAANGANPVAIIVPCHRIIGRDGSLTGYGGGLDRKRWLLRHESGALF